MRFNIWTDCEKRPLPDILSFIVDNRGKTVPTDEKGKHILIATNCIRNESLFPVFEKPRFLSDETYRSWFRAHPISGDIIFVCKGSPGRTCLVPDPVNFCIAQDMVALRVNEDIIYNKYLLAMLRSREIQAQINNTSVGDVIPHFKKQFFDRLLIPIPPMEVQKKLGNLYYELSIKEELNKRINGNLEQQAASFFFDRFVDNANPFWLEGTINDLGTVVGGGTPSKAKPEYYTEHGITWITPKDLSVDKSKFIAHGAEDITELGLRNSSASIMPPGTVLFSSRAPIGYIAIADGEITTNQGFKSVIPKENIGTAFVYYYLKNALPIIESMASGSTFKEISGSAMRSVPVVIPDADSLKEFSDFCKPLFQQQRILEAENRHLASIRDNLLPKLMSGEIDVTEVEL